MVNLLYLFFMIAAPEGANDTHLQALAALSRLLIDPEFVEKLKEKHQLRMQSNNYLLKQKYKKRTDRCHNYRVSE